MVVLLIDAANVVGSRPNGWWRDRAGAAARLVEQLAAVPGTEVTGGRGVVDEVVVVLEGVARAGSPATQVGRVRVVHAPCSGDDAVIDLCGPGVVLVTADRELSIRAQEVGAAVASPSRLLEVFGRPAKARRTLTNGTAPQ